MDFSALTTRWTRLAQSRTGKRLLGWLRWLFLAGILGLLAYQTAGIGWARIWEALPTEPLFYVIFLVIYLLLPLSEALIYRTAWPAMPLGEGFLTLLKKRVYNKDVLGYSGEVYLYLWAQKRVGVPARRVWGTLKDNAIASSVASTTFALGVLATLFLAGQIAVAERFIRYDATYVLAAVGVAGALAALSIKFRRTIFFLSARTLAAVFGIHVFRLMLATALQLAQWAVVLPEVEWRVWFTLIAVLVVTSRIPLLPARDLAFISVSVEVCQMMNAPSAGIVGMLLAASALDKGLNLVLFASATALKRSAPGVPEREGGVENALPKEQPVSPEGQRVAEVP